MPDPRTDVDALVRTHDLKTVPPYFERVLSGAKKAEIRKNDRDFHVGNLLRLREFIPAEVESDKPDRYTGREVTVRVTDALYGPCYGIKDGYVMLSFADLARKAVTSPTADGVNPSLDVDALVPADALAAILDCQNNCGDCAGTVYCTPADLARHAASLQAALTAANERIKELDTALDKACEQCGDMNHRENVRNGSPVDSGVWFVESPTAIKDFFLANAKAHEAAHDEVERVLKD